MPRISVPGLVEASNTERSIQAQVGRTINLFLETTQPGGASKAPAYLQGTPGMRPRAIWPDQPIRGLFQNDAGCFVVGGGLFGQLFEDYTIGPTFPVLNDLLPISWASNGSAGNQIILASGGNGYIYNTLTQAFTQIIDPDFPSPCRMVEFMDGYFLALKGGGSRSFSWSALEDGLSWDPLDVAERSEASDNLQALIRNHREIWLMGSLTTEVWYDSGDPTAIFQPLQGVFLEQGNAARFTTQRIDNTLIWVGSNADGQSIVWRADGYLPRRISTFGVEQQIQQHEPRPNWSSLVFQMNGHLFYALVIPENDRTWLYDVMLDRWVEWNHWNTTTATWEPHVVGTHCAAFETHLFGDRFSGAIYEGSMQFFDEQIVAPV